MMGREAGTIWNAKAADYVAAQFAKLGLRPAGENGTLLPGRAEHSHLATRRRARAGAQRRRDLSGNRSGAARRVRRDHRAQRPHRIHASRRSTTIRCARSTRSIRPLGADSPRAPAVGRGGDAHPRDPRQPAAHPSAAARLDPQRRRRRRQRNDRADRDRRSVRARRRASRAARFCSCRTPPKRRDCSARSGTRITRLFRSTRSSPRSTST